MGASWDERIVLPHGELHVSQRSSFLCEGLQYCHSFTFSLFDRKPTAQSLERQLLV